LRFRARAIYARLNVSCGKCLISLRKFLDNDIIVSLLFECIATIMQLSPYDKLSLARLLGNGSSQSRNWYVTGCSPLLAYLYLYRSSLMKRYYLYDSLSGIGTMRAMRRVIEAASLPRVKIFVLPQTYAKWLSQSFRP